LLYVAVIVAIMGWGFDEDLGEAVVVGAAGALVAILIPAGERQRSPQESGQEPR
jgi:hypothetical protein